MSLIERMQERVTASRESRLTQEEMARKNPYLMEALTYDKREGLRLAVKARWVALSIIALLFPYLNFDWSMLYYEALLLGFALIGWAQLKAGEVGHSRRELALLFLDLLLMTIALVVPNPFEQHELPTAMQFKFSSFLFFFVLLSAGTLAYSWRTIFAIGTWTTGLWIGAVVLVSLFGTQIPEISSKLEAAFAGHDLLVAFTDPNNVLVSRRVQEIVVFLIVAGILATNGWRTNQLLLKQSEVVRERANLARHFPPTIVNELADLDQPLGAVRSQKITVMFTDIVGFTRMAEQHSPDAVVALLREFHAFMESAVFNHQGTLDKFLGDGIMATFGTPNPSREDAANALRCAREMTRAIDDWNEIRQRTGKEPVRLSIGIHTGDVVLGDIGSERRLEFAALGDTVNVASRLETLTRDIDARTVISEAVVGELAGSDAADRETLLAGYRFVAAQQLRGRDDPIDVWMQPLQVTAEA